MIDKPIDPGKSGSLDNPGASSSKRPAATIDLQATEIERRDIGRDDGSDAGSDAAAAPREGEAGQDTGPPAREEPSPSTAASGGESTSRRSSAAGSVMSHVLAGGVGAVLAIVGVDYLANTTGLQFPPFSAGQIDQLSRRLSSLEEDAKNRGNDPASNLLREQVQALTAKVDQTTTAFASLGDGQSKLEQQTAKLDQLVAAQPQLGDAAGRIAKLESQFQLLAQSGAAGQSGNVGTMASLIAKVDTIGTNLDTHLAEMRKSLQSDLEKQSAHFEDRLSEVDKSMAVDTMKANTKALSDQIVGLKADSDKLHQDIATVALGTQQIRQDLGAVQQSTADLKTQLAAQASTFAKSQQLSDVNAATTKLQSDLATIAARDQTREQSAGRILLMLQLGNLKRAVDSGVPYAKELAEVKRLAPQGIVLGNLDAGAEQGLPTNAMLLGEFKDLAWSIVSADTKSGDEGSLLGQLWQGARSVVQVRRTGAVSGTDTDAILARTESKLQTGDAEGALREVSQLTGDARKIAEPWMAKLAARSAVDQAMSEVEQGLAKLMGPVTSPASGTN